MISIKIDDFKLNRDYFHKDVVKLLFVGRVEKAKGIHELLLIAEELKKRNLNFILDIVGGGALYNYILEEIKIKNLSKNIILHGQISDSNRLKSMYNDADLFVFPSHHEGFPRVLYEAMASALPIFTTFVGGISGRMKNLDNCIEIPSKNGTASAEIIYKYINDKKTLKLIGEAAQKKLKNIINGSLETHENLLIKELIS